MAETNGLLAAQNEGDILCHALALAGSSDRSVVSYREAGRHLGSYLGLDADLGQQVATELVAEGHLPRSFGRAIVKPTFDGLSLLAIAILARGAGLSRGPAAHLAVQGEREGFDGRGVAYGPCASLRVGDGSLTLALPAGPILELHRMEQEGRRNG